MLATDKLLPPSCQPTRAPQDEGVFYSGVDQAGKLCQEREGKQCMLDILPSVSQLLSSAF